MLTTKPKHLPISLSATSCPNNGKIHYVVDNLSTHSGYSFCEIVAELSNVLCPSQKQLDNLEKRVAWLTFKEKRIVIHFTQYHGSRLNLVEFWFGILNKKVLNGSYNSEEELQKVLYPFWINGILYLRTLFASPIMIKVCQEKRLIALPIF